MVLPMIILSRHLSPQRLALAAWSRRDDSDVSGSWHDSYRFCGHRPQPGLCT